MANWDAIIIGAGNAAFCTVHAACEKGASVYMLECAPEAEHGGNSRFADFGSKCSIGQNGLFPAVSCVLHQGPVQRDDLSGVVF